MRRALAVLLTLGVIVPAPVAARSYWSRAYPIAVAYWRLGEPCDGHIDVRWAPLTGRWAEASWVALGPTDRATNQCVITFDSSHAWNSMEFCGVAVHEVGHLLGLHHSTVLGSMMQPHPEKWFWPKRCLPPGPVA